MATIFVIDDDEQVRNFLHLFLEGNGYKVHQTGDGEEGIRAYRLDPPDLVLCDLFMERQEGLETIRRMLHEFPSARIIAMSGGGSMILGDFLRAAKRFGAVATLRKPLDLQVLLQTIKNFLAG